jgi:16S rRNA processing protein RimM
VRSGARARILLGRALGAHGLCGEVLIEAFAHPPQNIAAYGTLCDRSGARRFDVDVVRVTRRGVIARIAGVGDRCAAEALKGVEFFIDRDQLPGTREGEFYHADLVGLCAVDAAAQVIGTVVGVHNYGAGDLLEIRLANTRQSELVPFAESFVGRVDLAAGRLVVALPRALESEPDAPSARHIDSCGPRPKGARRAKASALRR